jgi:hypothetical protein
MHTRRSAIAARNSTGTTWDLKLRKDLISVCTALTNCVSHHRENKDNASYENEKKQKKRARLSLA